MGAIFTVAVAREGPLPGVKVALVPGRGVALSEVSRSGSGGRNQIANVGHEVTLMVGSEREGLPEEVIEEADQVAQIPIRTSSLNAAMATTIALYELSHRINA